MKDNEYEIPENPTIRQEYVRCGILIANNHMAHIFRHAGRMVRHYKKDTSVRQLVIC